MQRNHHFIAGLALTLFSLGWAGCQAPKIVAPLTGGYEEVSHPKRAYLGETEPPRVSFEHHGADGQTNLIWPSLYGVNEVIKGNLAIFVGDQAYVEAGTKGTHPRLFAVQTPELPLDLTDEILWRWAKTNGKDFAVVLEKFSLVSPAEKNGGLELQLEFDSDDKDWPEKSVLQLDWNQVAEIVRAVKTKGVRQKDVRWHTPFIGEKY
jgi:hypothetical protein